MAYTSLAGDTVKHLVATRAEARVYYVSMVGGKIDEHVMVPELIA